jgi:hypothetical protein
MHSSWLRNPPVLSVTYFVSLGWGYSHEKLRGNRIIDSREKRGIRPFNSPVQLVVNTCTTAFVYTEKEPAELKLNRRATSSDGILQVVTMSVSLQILVKFIAIIPWQFAGTANTKAREIQPAAKDEGAIARDHAKDVVHYLPELITRE